MTDKSKSQNRKSNNLKTVTVKDLNVTEPKRYAAPASFSTWVRVLMQNWRQGTVSVKGRSEVSYTTKKPWKQKGTGRARAGSARSPLWRGGGVTFGPQLRERKLKISKKLKKKVMMSLLFDFLNNGKVVCVDWTVEGGRPKTSVAYQLLRQMELIDKKVTLFVAPHDVLSFSSFANISNVNALSFDQPNAFNLANSDCWMFFERDFDQFKEMVSKWT